MLVSLTSVNEVSIKTVTKNISLMNLFLWLWRDVDELKLISDDKNYDENYDASSLTRRDRTRMLFEDYRTFKIHPIGEVNCPVFQNVHLSLDYNQMRGVCIASLSMNKMQHLCIAFIDVKFAYGGNWRMDLYPFCKDTFMWPSVNGNVSTNQTSEKMHEVTRCKQAQCVSVILSRAHTRRIQEHADEE